MAQYFLFGFACYRFHAIKWREAKTQARSTGVLIHYQDNFARNIGALMENFSEIDENDFEFRILSTCFVNLVI